MISAQALDLLALIWLSCISAVSVVVCIYDKIISKRGKVSLRVPEHTLLILSALGGSVAMLVMMLITRHKTKHVKFMLGIPIIIAVQAALILCAMHFLPLTNLII